METEEGIELKLLCSNINKRTFIELKVRRKGDSISRPFEDRDLVRSYVDIQRPLLVSWSVRPQ